MLEVIEKDGHFRVRCVEKKKSFLWPSKFATAEEAQAAIQKRADDYAKSATAQRKRAAAERKKNAPNARPLEEQPRRHKKGRRVHRNEKSLQ